MIILKVRFYKPTGKLYASGRASLSISDADFHLATRESIRQLIYDRQDAVHGPGQFYMVTEPLDDSRTLEHRLYPPLQ